MADVILFPLSNFTFTYINVYTYMYRRYMNVLFRSKWVVKNLSGLLMINGGLYKEATIWTYIMKHLFMCRTQDSFSAADNLIKHRGNLDICKLIYSIPRFIK